LKTNILFIINPISGTGKQKNIASQIEKYLDYSKFNPQIEFTEFNKHASEIAKNAIGKFQIIVAVGGDGTINEIVKSIYNSDIILALIPSGSGNGLARHLKIPQNISKAIKKFNQQNISEIDLIKINDEFSVNVSGFGFDALVAYRFSQSQKRGPLTYVKHVLKEYFKYKSQEFVLKIENEVHSYKAIMLTVANATEFGNNIAISPKSKCNDGKFEIIVFPKIPNRLIPAILYRLVSKTIHNSKYVKTISAKKIQIINNQKLLSHIDGEVRYFNNNVDIEIIEKAIKVIC
jgi:YegS/Rv2252/BmrU family lipid kinase